MHSRKNLIAVLALLEGRQIWSKRWKIGWLLVNRRMETNKGMLLMLAIGERRWKIRNLTFEKCENIYD